MGTETLYKDAVALLQQLIAVASYSKYEDGTADVLLKFLETRGIDD